MQWQKRPILYEIHTAAWLADLSARYHQKITLGTVPDAEWDALAALHINAVWFMGVWQRSPAGIAVSNDNSMLQQEFARALPDYSTRDNLGSAYCVRAYVVAEQFGGNEELAQARAQLHKRNLALVLDYVPNHLARDHAWVTPHPEYFVHGTPQDLERAPHEFFEANGQIIANGRDPHSSAWEDVAQVDAFNAGYRKAAIETVKQIAAQCDGMRCDMAMLLINDIFAQTWGARGGAMPPTEFWSDLISAVKQAFPDVLFIAEVYWEREYQLMQLGFDYCYDKRLYDRLVDGNAAGVRAHLGAGLDFQDKLIRFIENHDEQRAATVFAPPRERAATVFFLTLPGAKLMYEGQLEGRKIKTPVFLSRRAPEPRDYELDLFYRALLKTVDTDLFHTGEWQLCEGLGWGDNSSFQNIVAWTWTFGTHRTLIVVNYSARRSQAMIRLAWSDLGNRTWRLSDTLNGDVFHRDGNQLAEAGLYVDLDAWRFHILTFE